jgi:hypothetical protein
MLTDQDALALIEKLRRTQPDNREMWGILDDFEWLVLNQKIIIKCLACEKRKKAKTAAMKKWRKKGTPLKPDRYAG